MLADELVMEVLSQVSERKMKVAFWVDAKMVSSSILGRRERQVLRKINGVLFVVLFLTSVSHSFSDGGEPPHSVFSISFCFSFKARGHLSDKALWLQAFSIISSFFEIAQLAHL